MVKSEDYDIFVCYDETTAKDFASALYAALSNRRGYKVFVAHIARDLMIGDFRVDNINPTIEKCKVFILINSLDALSRPEIIREVKHAFPNGTIQHHDFWVFRENKPDVKLVTENFKNDTKINLENINQNSFNNETELVRIALRKCDNKRQFVTETLATQTVPLAPIRVRTTLKVVTQINTNQLFEELDDKIKNKKYEEALEICDQLLTFDNFNVGLLNTRGILSAILGNHEEAIVNLELGISIDKKNPALWNNKALVFAYSEKLNDALTAVNRALDFDPNDIEIIKNKGYILSELGRFDEALKFYEKGLSGISCVLKDKFKRLD